MKLYSTSIWVCIHNICYIVQHYFIHPSINLWHNGPNPRKNWDSKNNTRAVVAFETSNDPSWNWTSPGVSWLESSQWTILLLVAKNQPAKKSRSSVEAEYNCHEKADDHIFVQQVKVKSGCVCRFFGVKISGDHKKHPQRSEKMTCSSKTTRPFAIKAAPTGRSFFTNILPGIPRYTPEI